MRKMHDLLATARGDVPADLLMRNCRIVNVFSGEIEDADIAILGEFIAGVGSGYSARSEIDLRGAFVAPGLIDAHVHIESSLCTPPNFAQALASRGVTTVIADPHEIANVCGIEGIRFMYEASRDLPVRVVLMAPSCVPATSMGTAGAKLSASDLKQLLDEGIVHGLAEVMNFPGVIHSDSDMLDKLATFAKRPRDGHAPGLRGKQLNAYAASGIGSDHECVTVEEAKEKLARGMYVLIREATNARNLDALIPLITEKNARRICLCTDDRTPVDLLDQGSVDYMLRRVIEAGVDPITAFRLCTLNPSEWFNLPDRGAIAPGRLADFFIFDDLKNPVARRVTRKDIASYPIPAKLRQTFRVGAGAVSFAIPARGSRIRVIGSLADQLLTEHRVVDATIVDGHAVADTSRDILKMAVIERHGVAGRVGLGFIHGIGLRKGAIAGTVAHDHHNLVIIGCDDVSMQSAKRAVAEMGGGLVVTHEQNVIAQLPLPVAGLMSDRPIEEVRAGYDKLLAAAKMLGSPLHDPFMAMSFMALEVIPKLKLTDQGLVDVEKFQIVDQFV